VGWVAATQRDAQPLADVGVEVLHLRDSQSLREARRSVTLQLRIRGSSIGSGVISETSIQRRASLAPAKVIVLMNAIRVFCGWMRN